ncbi:uncharacterized protein [Apostichopus japonicus]|uniref:uncharacterized protein n=1 Tax=Stichopus japonicus TaxID=307972 RepID=UPI003AB48D07
MGNQAIKEKESKHCNQGTGSYQKSKTTVNRESLVDALERAYHRKYAQIKPVPFEPVSLCASNVYIEGAIKVLDRRKGEKDPCRWTAIQSRHDLFKPLKDPDGTRILIDGEPGYGKSTLLRQYAHDFFNQSPESPVNRFSIFVLLPLKELCNVKCIYQAIRSQLPDDNPLTAEAIKDVINDNVSALLIGFDGFDEYSDRGSPQSFVAQIMNNKLLEQCTAICSTRKGYIPHLPSPTMKHFRLSGFNKDMQKAYIKNAFGSTDNAGVLKDRILRQLQQNPAIDAICKVPLFFVVFAHIRGNEEITENLDTVTGFFAEMMRTLLSHQRNKDAPDQLTDSSLEPMLRQLAELAFNGLCSQNQKLLWEASELNKLIEKATLEMYTSSGILVQEEMPYNAKAPGANESFWETSKTHFRFFHKIFQEYFAAFHISGLAKQEDTKHLAKKALVNLNHIEHQYVYRFACGLNKATAKIILDLFTKNSKVSRIFATLCLLETDSEDKYNEVRKYCCSGLVVNHYDSKSLQTSTIQLLQIASHQKIPLASLELSCCVKSVNLEQETLHLFSGLVISKLETVEELTLTFTNCVDIAASLLGLFSKITVLKAVRFKHSKLPRSFDDRCFLSDLGSNQCEVSWKNLSLEVKLNLSTGRWENANGDEMTDEDYERMLCEPFLLNFEELKRKLAEKLPQNSCAKIARHFSLQEDQVAEINGHKSSTSGLLDVLEERGYIHAANISRLVMSLRDLEITGSVLEIAESYQTSIGTETSYDQFLASLGSHLTLSYPEKLCDHFKFSVVEKKEIVESDTPGIAFLLTLNKRGSINATTVGKLVEPLTKYKLVQAVAKVKEYQSMVDRSGEKKTTVPTLKDKQDMLSTCIKRKITNLLEVMTPTPWKKSCQWKYQELYIPLELILTSSKSKPDISKNDLHSILRYQDIFTDSKLNNKTRIILEGEQGSGKTMLSSQFTYFWMTQEVEGAPMVIYLPLKFVEDMTIEEAIKRFYIPKDIPINEQDIKAMLNSGMDTKYLVLDGLDDYNCTTQYWKSSEVMKVMRKEKYPSCLVMLTSSSNRTHDLPQCLMLKLMMFDEEKRQSYIENIIPGDKQLEFTRAVERSNVLRDLCSTPLIFAFIAHNMASLKLDQIHINSVGSIMEEMINILFSQAGSEYKEINIMKVKEHSERLSEIAFKGLCRGYQQLQWPKSYFDKSIPNMKQWLNSGILILEEPLSEGKDQQTIERDATGSDAKRSEETVRQSNKFEQVVENETTTKVKPLDWKHDPYEESLCREGVQHVTPKEEKSISTVLETRRPPEKIPKATCSSPFGSSSYPNRCPAIVKSLIDRHRSLNGVVPENILNIAFLCFAELDEQTDNAHTMDTVKLIITEPVIIRGEDNKLLQQSKISVLRYALDKKIEVGCLKLIDIVVNVDCDRLVFNSGLSIELLHTLNILEVYRWDQRLSERQESVDYQNLITYISNLESLKKA